MAPRSRMKDKADRSAVDADTRTPLPRPGEYLADPLLWASWLYHHDEMTQSQIADLMAVSRATVVNYLQQARDLHYV